MVCVTLNGMDVRYLDYGNQRKQNKTHDGYRRPGTKPGVKSSAVMGLKSRQETPSTLRIHIIGCGAAFRGYALDRIFRHVGRQTLSDPVRLNCGAMAQPVHLRGLLRGALAILLASAITVPAFAQKTLPLKPDQQALAANHRLILKDGTYQLVRKYEVVGDRVRYISIERGGDWEELPENLIDWDATRRWERDHAAATVEDPSPAMKEAEVIDKEEAAERDEQTARMPEVANGLELPNQDGVFALDTFEGTPELVELLPNEINANAPVKTKHGISTLNPFAGKNASLELDGANSKVHLHVNDPAIYLSLNVPDNAEQVVSHAMTVDTGGAKEMASRKHGAHSASSGFALVRVDQRNAMRIVGAIHMSPNGTVTQDEDVMTAKVEVLPGKHWLKITPDKPLLIGEYALVEILSASDINQSVWDFRVDPRLGDNPGSIGPIFKKN